MTPVVLEWARVGCLLVAVGVVALVWAVLTGPHDVGLSVVDGIIGACLSAGFVIGPPLRQMEAPGAAAADAALVTRGTAAVWFLGALVALLGLAAAFVPDAMFHIGCVGLSLGAIWLAAAGIVRYRELRWFHARLVAGRGTASFRRKTTSYYLLPFN